MQQRRLVEHDVQRRAASAAETSPAASSAPESSADVSAASPADAAAPPADSGWCDTVKEKFPGIEGTTVGVYTTIVAPEDKPYVDAFKQFTDCTGANVQYEGSKEFEAQIVVRVQSGNPPDIGIFPQPGLLSQIVNDTGAVKPLSVETRGIRQAVLPRGLDELRPGQRHPVRHPEQRRLQVAGLVLAEDLHGEGLTRCRRPGRS